jgi:hypothetical protein
LKVPAFYLVGIVERVPVAFNKADAAPRSKEDFPGIIFILRFS